MNRYWLLAALVAVGCRKGPSEDDCKQLLDHLVDLEFKKAGTQGGSNAQVKADLDKQKQAVSEQKAPDFLDQCSKKMAKSRVECALGATNLDDVAKCDSDNK